MTQWPPIIAAHYSEIALKGGNRAAFLRRLKNNIGLALKGEPVTALNHVESRLLIRLGEAERAEAVARKLQRVFGLQWLSIATPVPRAALADGLGPLCETAAALARRDAGDARTFKVDTRRSDQRFPIPSPEVNRVVGAAVNEAIGLPVRLNGPDFTVHVLILNDAALVFTRRLPGQGGLPAGTGGRVMALLSGGIDSPAAAFLLMKRGCRCDFVHFYTGRAAAEADAGKIRRLVAILRGYAPTALHLYLAPSYPYESRAIGAVDDPHDMVMFRRYMLRTAQRLAKRASCQALVTGDSLGQVASQTIFNLRAIGQDCDLPVFRPLIGFDKLEISALARAVGTFDVSVEPYRDCCSLRSPHPVLRARPDAVRELSLGMDLEAAVEEALQAAARVVVDEAEFPPSGPANLLR